MLKMKNADDKLSKLRNVEFPIILERPVKKSSITVSISFDPQPDADERLAKVARILMANDLSIS